MDINLNEISLITTTPILNNWDRVIEYFKLVKSLSDLTVDQILVNADRKTAYIADVALSSLYTPGVAGLSTEQSGVLITLIEKYHSFTSIKRKESFFVNDNNCASLADAYCRRRPVVSITFDGKFTTDEIKGIFKESDDCKQGKKVSVVNLYKKDDANIKSLPSFSEIAKVNAEVSPLWNQDLIRAYLSIIKHANHNPAFAFSSTGEKTAYIIEHGTVIAELCGWKIHPGLSKKNSTREMKRLVFFSAGFKNDNVYLCLDLEHSDFHFELCDRRGHHLGEYCWDGTRTSEPDSLHNIKV